MRFARWMKGMILASSGVLFSFSGGVASAASLKLGAEPYASSTDEFVSAIVMTAKTHQALYAYHPDESVVAASLTKLANALTFVSLHPKWQAAVRLKASDEVGGGRLHASRRSLFTVRDLFYSAIVGSANNAAMALARLSGLPRATYLARMNNEARTAGALRSVFVDPSGMELGNKTTASDMALISLRAFREPGIRFAASANSYEFVIRNTGQRKVIKNTSRSLMEDPEMRVLGSKTGYLPQSGYHIALELRPVDRAHPETPDRDLVIVVLGAKEKARSFQSAKNLALWAWKNFDY